MARDVNGKRTKIVATIGPASNSPEVLRKMVRAGLDVVRLNFSHIAEEDYSSITELIASIRQIAEEEACVVAIMADLQGPKIRLGILENDPLPIKPGDKFTITTREDADQSKGELPLPHPEFVRDIRVGNRLLIDDGDVEMRVNSITNSDLVCEVIVGDKLSSRKGVAAPQSRLSLSAITDKDERDVAFIVTQDIDYIAMSFVRSDDDMRQLRWLIGHSGGDMKLIAKIEKAEALDVMDTILEHSDGIMVARGDLGIEIPAAEVPVRQKDIIAKCNFAGKPVITATQMLSSMVSNPRPTRAEASDVANAIFDGTDAIMLSNETATGNFPVQAVETMTAIAEISEKHLYDTSTKWSPDADNNSLSGVQSKEDAISFATARIAKAVDAKLIITATWSGYTARRVARERPSTPIVCITPNKKTYNLMAMVWGVIPLLVDQFGTIDDLLGVTEDIILDNGLAKEGDILVIIAGVPFGVGGQTNFLKIHAIGDDSSFTVH